MNSSTSILKFINPSILVNPSRLVVKVEMKKIKGNEN